MIGHIFSLLQRSFLLLFTGVLVFGLQPFSVLLAADGQGPPAVPVQIASVEKKRVAARVSLIGDVEPALKSTVASEGAGIVEQFPVREGDFVKKGDLLVRIRSRELLLRIKAAEAARERIRVGLEKAAKELKRVNRLKKTASIAEKRVDEAEADYWMHYHQLAQSQVEIERLRYEVDQKRVVAPFSGFVVKEQTMVGEWLQTGGAVVTLHDLSRILITVNVPARYYVQLLPNNNVSVSIKDVSSTPFAGKIDAMLTRGDPKARTFPIKVGLKNGKYRIKSGMEARVTFDLSQQKEVLLVPKDALVPAGNQWRLFRVIDGKAVPVSVNVRGYYDGSAAVAGGLQVGDRVVIRGNERLRPGQLVKIQ